MKISHISQLPPEVLSDNRTFARQYKGWSRIKFWLRVYYRYWKANRMLRETLRKKMCYYGPFKGEFGHMTAHTAPFLMYLHSKGVKIVYCGMEIHKPLLIDEKGKSIVHDFRPLRDFFAEVPPSSNSTIPPPDVQTEIEKFDREAWKSGLPFWNIGEDFYYWFIHRNWLLKGPYMKTYQLDKVYKTKEEFSVCVFPRSKGAAATHNNGEPWNYNELVNVLSRYFEKVYVVGHPALSVPIEPKGNVEVCLSSDNRVILEKCSNSKLIVTQHSGVNNLGEYTDTQVLIIYKGGNRIADIGSIYNTLRFRPYIGTRHELSFAFSMEEVVSFVKDFAGKHDPKKQSAHP